MLKVIARILKLFAAFQHLSDLHNYFNSPTKFSAIHFQLYIFEYFSKIILSIYLRIIEYLYNFN